VELGSHFAMVGETDDQRVPLVVNARRVRGADRGGPHDSISK
jgi:hypothetical protein